MSHNGNVKCQNSSRILDDHCYDELEHVETGGSESMFNNHIKRIMIVIRMKIKNQEQYCNHHLS